MTEFIYNEAYKSGGHWHVAKGLRISVVPRKVETKTHEVIDWSHGVRASEASPTGRWYVPRSYFGNTDACTRCGKPDYDHPQLPRYGQHAFEERQVYPILGDVTSIVVTPEHKTASAKAACGSVGTIKVSNLKQREVYNRVTAKKHIGKTLTIEHVVTRLLVETEFVPEPLCGHCFKLMERGDAVG